MTRKKSEIEQELRAEIGRLIGVLGKIRDIVECDDPRFPSMEWYKSKVEHVRRYLGEVFGDEECSE
jgi:hypothetical protein